METRFFIIPNGIFFISFNCHFTSKNISDLNNVCKKKVTKSNRQYVVMLND